jgi:hypothetical protein
VPAFLPAPAGRPLATARRPLGLRAQKEENGDGSEESDTSVLRQLLGFKGATTDTKAFLNWKVSGMHTPHGSGYIAGLPLARRDGGWVSGLTRIAWVQALLSASFFFPFGASRLRVLLYHFTSFLSALFTRFACS